MPPGHLNHDFDFYLVRDFFDVAVCGEMIAEMRRAAATAAVTYGRAPGGTVDERVRRAMKVTPSSRTRDFVSAELDRQRPLISRHFQISLSSFEEPQFLRYRVGDFFVAHQDGNTGLLQLESDCRRRVSVSIFLNDESGTAELDSYAGGTLIFSEWRNDRRFQLQAETGMLVAFRSELTHEVTPVTRGERFSIVTWFG